MQERGGAQAEVGGGAPGEGAPRRQRVGILVVDDEAGIRDVLVRAFGTHFDVVDAADSAEDAQVLMQRQRYDVVVLDVRMRGKSGVAWLAELREQGHTGEVILVTAYADLDMAIEALRAGASDFIMKPFRLPQILDAVRRALERARLRRENFVLRRRLEEAAPPVATMIGESAAMRALRDSVQRLAQVDSTVLLYGESGTGKELVAQALHAGGPRARGPFVPVNCGGLAGELIESELFGHARGAFTGATRARDGLFLYANGGTLFLDEIGELPPSLQATLLRVLEERSIRPVGSEQTVPVDVRIVAATNRRLPDEVAAGRFRKDLYYRLQVLELALPPLREHKEDIPVLVGHFMAALAPTLGLGTISVTEAELDYLREYDWPGNVRELRNLVERSLILGRLNVSALYQRPPASRDAERSDGAPVDLASLERRHIQSVLDSVGGDKTRAARLLGISRRTLERRSAEWSGG
jgi:DNA-binding NtrC family response regulator